MNTSQKVDEYSVRSALRGSLHAIKSDEPGRYGRDGYLSGVDDTTLYVLCNMILSYSGIVRSDDDIRTAVREWCTNKTNAMERYGHISYLGYEYCNKYGRVL